MSEQGKTVGAYWGSGKVPDGPLPSHAEGIEQARAHARAARVAQGLPEEDPADAEFRERLAERPKTADFFARVSKAQETRRKRGR